MPILETKAKLWHPTKEQRDAYDDLMIANIELKSLDFDDENFSPVFCRTKQENFLDYSEKYKKDISRVMRPFKTHQFEEFVDKYYLYKRDHSYWRDFTVTKFMSGFGIGYIALRELPLRNFYARCFVMYCLIAKFADHCGVPLPFYGTTQLLAARDQFYGKDIYNYNNVSDALNYIELPTARNQIRESKLWRSRQPAHLLRDDLNYIPNYLTKFYFLKEKQAHWDGTMNQPLHRLADPYHKDSHMIYWQ